MAKAIAGNRHANVPVSLRQVWEEVRALRDRLRARDVKGEVPQMRERESVPNTQQRFRGDLKEELKLKAEPHGPTAFRARATCRNEGSPTLLLT
jgi:hypothetical protein